MRATSPFILSFPAGARSVMRTWQARMASQVPLTFMLSHHPTVVKSKRIRGRRCLWLGAGQQEDARREGATLSFRLATFHPPQRGHAFS